VADDDHNTVLEITPGGTSSVFASSGLDDPSGLAFDAAGNLYVANADDGTVEKFTPNGVGTLFASGLNTPVGVAVDAAGNVYVASFFGGTITKFNPAGGSSVFASNVNGPTGLAFDAAGNLYSADNGDGHIEKFTPGGGTSDFAATGAGALFGLAYHGENLYAVDANTNIDANASNLYRIAANGTSSGFARLSGNEEPFGITADAAGNLYVSTYSGTIEKFTPGGAETTFMSGLDNDLAFLAFGPVPEPSTWMAVGIGAGLLGLTLRRRTHACDPSMGAAHGDWSRHPPLLIYCWVMTPKDYSAVRKSSVG
jgi:sugar lactone lactonase YvrE